MVKFLKKPHIKLGLKFYISLFLLALSLGAGCRMMLTYTVAFSDSF